MDESPEKQSAFVSTAAAAETLGISPATVRKMCREGKIPHLAAGRVIRISSGVLAKIVESGTLDGVGG